MMIAKIGVFIALWLTIAADKIGKASVSRMLRKGLPVPIPAQPKGKRGRPKGSKSGPKASKLGTPQTIAAPIVHPESPVMVDAETPIGETPIVVSDLDGGPDGHILTIKGWQGTIRICSCGFNHFGEPKDGRITCLSCGLVWDEV